MTVREAEAERDRAFTNLDATDQADELGQILDAIRTVAFRGGEFTANDVRPLLPKGVNTYRIGRAFGRAIELRMVEVIGLDKSNKRNTHGKRVNVYRLAAAA